MKTEHRDWLRAIGIAAGAGMTLLCTILLGLYAGHRLDDAADWSPWGIMAGAFGGGAVGLWILIRDLVD